MNNKKSLIEMVLMPLVIAVVGIGGILYYGAAGEERENVERRAAGKHERIG
jgi:hypothetical protein